MLPSFGNCDLGFTLCTTNLGSLPLPLILSRIKHECAFYRNFIMRPVNHLQRFCERGLLRDSMHSIALFAACCAAAAAPAAAFAPAGAALPASRARAVPRVSSRRRIPSPKLIA